MHKFKKCSHVYAYWCAQMLYTIQHRPLPVILSLKPPDNHHSSCAVYWSTGNWLYVTETSSVRTHQSRTDLEEADTGCWRLVFDAGWTNLLSDWVHEHGSDQAIVPRCWQPAVEIIRLDLHRLGETLLVFLQKQPEGLQWIWGLTAVQAPLWVISNPDT